MQNSFPTIRNRYYGPGASLVARLTSELPGDTVNEAVFSFTLSKIKLDNVAAPYVSLSRRALLDATPCQMDPVFSGTSGVPCGIGSIFSSAAASGKLPGIAIAGNNAAYGGIGFNLDPSYMPWEHTNPTYTVADNVQKRFGRHSLSADGLLTIFQRNQTNGPIGAATGDVQGLLTFNNEAALGSTGNAFADFLMMGDTGNSGGNIANFQQDSAQLRYHQAYKLFEPYLQDDWKATPHLTINVGVRVSMFGVYTERNHRAYNWTQATFSRAVAEGVVVDPISGQLFDDATQQPLPIFQANGRPDPRVTNGIVQCGVGAVPAGCMKSPSVEPGAAGGLCLGSAWGRQDCPAGRVRNLL